MAAILAAGKGERFGADKTALALGGKPLWRWSYETFSRHPRVDEVVLVTAPERVAGLRAALPGKRIIEGGLTRQQSSLAALAFAESIDADILLLQDAARPFTRREVIERVIDGTIETGAAAPALPVTDTIKEVTPGGIRTLRREHLVAMQTPQGVRVPLLRQAHETGPGEATDDLALLEAIGVHPRIVAGDDRNFKVTFPEDLARASALVRGETRTGIGYDVHAFSSDPTRPLWLGGIRFDGHRGLEGHSDADVLLHAVVDAILGAAALGDIGQHFPPSEAEWKNRASIYFLGAARKLLDDAGWRVVNIDATCIAESPKIMPRAQEIREAMAVALDLTCQDISVKATTNEGLGAIGRKEGIAAFAIATISRVLPVD